MSLTNTEERGGKGVPTNCHPDDSIEKFSISINDSGSNT